MKTLFCYRFRDNLKSLGLLLIFMTLLSVLLAVFAGGAEMNGMTTLTSGFWALVIGVVILRGDLRLGVQFGVGRKSAFWGSMLACGLAFAAAAAMLTAYTWVLQLLTAGNPEQLSVMDLYQVLYSRSASYVMPPSDYLTMAVFALALNLCLGFFGTLCTAAFWRLGRIGKWILGIAMGAVPVVGFSCLGGWTSPWLWGLLRTLVTNPWAMIGFLLVWAAVFLAGTWLLSRRANITAAVK